MATRQETQNKRRAMRESIIESCRSGEVRDGDLMPPVRDLARQYGLSVNLASEVVQSLVAEGILHARPGAGTIAGHPRPTSAGTYLFLLPADASPEYIASSFLGAAQRGFEVAIAGLGGAILTLETVQARQYAAEGQLPPLAGVFSIHGAAVFSIHGAAVSEFSGDAEIPRACFGGTSFSEAPLFDCVRFDDFGGGQHATRHLLAAGHENIAFLALHAPDAPHHFFWSAEREMGWRETMHGIGKSCDELAFHPVQTPSLRANVGSTVHGAEQAESAREAVLSLLPFIREQKVTAVIAANFIAARTLFAELQESGFAADFWPAVVCFDGFDGLDNHVVSALNLPWDEVGKAGAQLLWERNVGRLRGPSAVRLVPMQLIPRLTCRPDWRENSGLVMPHLEELSLARPVF